MFLLWDSPLGLGDHCGLAVAAVDACERYLKHSLTEPFYGVPYAGGVPLIIATARYYRTPQPASASALPSDGESKRQPVVHAERVVPRERSQQKRGQFWLGASAEPALHPRQPVAGVKSWLSESQFGPLITVRRLWLPPFVNLDAGWQRGTGALMPQLMVAQRASEPVAPHNNYTYTVSFLQPFRVMDQAFSRG